jgi:hypothetical protein
MTDRRVLPVFGAIVIAVLFILSMALPTQAHAGLRSATTDPVTSEPDTSEPGTSEPATSEPTTSGPTTSTPTTGSADSVEDEADPVDTTVAIIGTIGFVALIGVAAWWMVRRRNDDDEPHPRQPVLDDPLPGQDLL